MSTTDPCQCDRCVAFVRCIDHRTDHIQRKLCPTCAGCMGPYCSDCTYTDTQFLDDHNRTCTVESLVSRALASNTWSVDWVNHKIDHGSRNPKEDLFTRRSNGVVEKGWMFRKCSSYMDRDTYALGVGINRATGELWIGLEKKDSDCITKTMPLALFFDLNPDVKPVHVNVYSGDIIARLHPLILLAIQDKRLYLHVGPNY